jgi:hypothetical protein
VAAELLVSASSTRSADDPDAAASLRVEGREHDNITGFEIWRRVFEEPALRALDSDDSN